MRSGARRACARKWRAHAGRNHACADACMHGTHLGSPHMLLGRVLKDSPDSSQLRIRHGVFGWDFDPPTLLLNSLLNSYHRRGLHLLLHLSSCKASIDFITSSSRPSLGEDVTP